MIAISRFKKNFEHFRNLGAPVVTQNDTLGRGTTSREQPRPRPYTTFLAAVFLLCGLAVSLSKPAGQAFSLLVRAVGTNSRLLESVSLTISVVLARWCALRVVAGLYKRYSLRSPFEDENGFILAGGRDIIAWSWSVCLFFCLYLAARYVPEGVPAFCRPFMLVGLHAGMSGLTAYTIADQVYLRLFGPPTILEGESEREGVV
jgi:hypothetical protein